VRRRLIETRYRPRPSAVRVRASARPRGRVAVERRPGPLERLLAGLRAPGFWWWLLAKLETLAMLLVGVTVLYHLLTSPTYYVSEVTIDDNQLLAAQQVV